MHFARFLSIKNIRRKPARAAALIVLSALLSLSVFGGTIIISSLQNGLKSLETRLGADVVVIPAEAQRKNALETILIQGVPGYFYMDDSVLTDIRSMDSVKEASPQFFLASASAGCCSVAVQLIGFDPETDFSIQPWIRENYAKEVGYCDIIVGSQISMPSDHSLKFYNTSCRIVSQLDDTGTALDTAVYANMDTIHKMMENSNILGFGYFDNIDVNHAISSVMVNVSDGYSAEEVAALINQKFDGVIASPTSNMVSSVSSGLDSVVKVIGILTVVIWLLAIIILVVVYKMVSNERIKEYAVLRTTGASQKLLSRIITTESAIISIVGSLTGILLSLLIVFPFTSVIKDSLGLPYLLPSAPTVILLAVCAIVVSTIAGLLSSIHTARRISNKDTSLILREGA